MRRALHVLRDDPRARGGPVSRRRRVGERGRASRGPSPGDRADRNTHRSLRRGHGDDAVRAGRGTHSPRCRGSGFDSAHSKRRRSTTASVSCSPKRDRIAPHLHAPLQSGSDTVLKRMGRHWYKAASYAAAVERIAASVPVFGLGADIIAGFPGETEDDHRCTVALADSLPFTYLHVFPYSARPGTAAERLDGHVTASTIERRAAELRAICRWARRGAPREPRWWRMRSRRRGHGCSTRGIDGGLPHGRR